MLEAGTLRPIPDLSSFSKNRTACGVDLFKQGYADKLVLTGGNSHVFREGLRDAQEMKRWAERLGVSADAIVTEEQSRTTYENATETKRLLGPRHQSCWSPQPAICLALPPSLRSKVFALRRFLVIS